MSLKMDFSVAPIADVEADIGRRLESIRLAQNISQSDLAGEAGVSRRTITRLENGGGISVETLIRILRALGIADRLDALVPDPSVRPIDRVRLKGKQRQRARHAAGARQVEWTWGNASEANDSEANDSDD
jgi:putative transcriptional regulator